MPSAFPNRNGHVCETGCRDLPDVSVGLPCETRSTDTGGERRGGRPPGRARREREGVPARACEGDDLSASRGPSPGQCVQAPRRRTSMAALSRGARGGARSGTGAPAGAPARIANLRADPWEGGRTQVAHPVTNAATRERPVGGLHRIGATPCAPRPVQSRRVPWAAAASQRGVPKQAGRSLASCDDGSTCSACFATARAALALRLR
jgi:hypothetical protein